jgi:hypothetical protein
MRGFTVLEKAELDLTLTPTAYEKIRRKLSAPGFDGKIPALMLEQTSPDVLTWRVTYYDRESVDTAEFKALLLRCSGIDLIVPQWNFVDVIKGGSLDWTGTAFTLNGKAQLEIKRAPK